MTDDVESDDPGLPFSIGLRSSISLLALPFIWFKVICRLYDGKLRPSSADGYSYALRRLLASIDARDPAHLRHGPKAIKPRHLQWHVDDLERSCPPATAAAACATLLTAIGHVKPRLDTSQIKVAQVSPENAPLLEHDRCRALPREKRPRDLVAAFDRLERARSKCRSCRHGGAGAAEAAQCTCASQPPLAPVSVENAKGDILRYLGAQDRHANLDWRTVSTISLLNRSCLGHYRSEVHDEVAPWLTADRMKALRFAIDHAYPGAELGDLDAEIADLRATHPNPDSQPRPVRSIAFEEISKAERERFDQALKPRRVGGTAGSHKKLRAVIVASCRHTWRMLHFALRHDEEGLQLQDYRERDLKRSAHVFKAFLEANGCRPRVVAQRLREMLMVLRRMLANEKDAPDFTWLSCLIRDIRRTDPYQPVIAPDATPKELRRVGIRLVDDARRRIALLEQLSEDRRPVKLGTVAKQALWGTAIILLAWLPLRASNLIMLEVTQILRRDAEGFWILAFPGTAMKNGKPFYQDVPANVGQYLTSYDNKIRPLLLDGLASAAFWPGRNGEPLSVSAFQRQVPKIILCDIGVAVSLHKFRTLKATAELGDLASAFLHHWNAGSRRAYVDKKKRRAREKNAVGASLIAAVL